MIGDEVLRMKESSKEHPRAEGRYPREGQTGTET